MTKCCRLCGESKPLTEFYPDKRTRDGLTSRCRTCVKRQTKEWREGNRERDSDTNRRSRRTRNLRKRYNLTPEEYDERMAAAEGKCSACGKERTLVMDHDHATGAVRDPLCIKCNLALGQVDDDPEILRALIAYLERHR